MAELDSADRLAVMHGRVVDTERDPVLEGLVVEAAAIAGAPASAVSMIMGTVQYFRAAQGLPPELGVTYATSRCDSFCQFVVEGESSFRISHASEDERVLQRVVEMYSIQAYLGVPVTLRGQIVGSLCVFDVEPREFSSEVKAKLEPLAAKVSARLEELAVESEAEAIEAVESAKLVSELEFQARLLERAMSEVGPLVRLGQGLSSGTLSQEEAARAATLLDEASPMFSLLIEETRRLSAMSSRLSHSPRGVLSVDEPLRDPRRLSPPLCGDGGRLCDVAPDPARADHPRGHHARARRTRLGPQARRADRQDRRFRGPSAG